MPFDCSSSVSFEIDDHALDAFLRQSTGKVDMSTLLPWRGTSTAIQADLIAAAVRSVYPRLDRRRRMLMPRTIRHVRTIEALESWRPVPETNPADNDHLRQMLLPPIIEAIDEITTDVVVGDGATMCGLHLQLPDPDAFRVEEDRRYGKALEALADAANTDKQIDQSAIRREIRTEIRRTRAQIDAVLLRIGGRQRGPVRKPIYASAEATAARRSQKQAEKDRLDGMWMTNGHDIINLGKAAESRAKSRRTQAYVMQLGLDALAREQGLTPVFLTLTVPPAYHPNPRIGCRSFDPACGPVAGRRHLSTLWRDFRKALWDADIKPPFGVKVGELHQDGAPHLHALLYVTADDIDTVRDLLDLTLPWQTARRGRLIVVDGCAAASYVFPYLFDALSGPDDDPGGEAQAAGISADDRHMKAKVKFKDALAAGCADIGMRRLAWIGLERGALGTWQRIHHVAALSNDRARADAMAGMSDAMAAGVEAMQSQNWGNALKALGLVRALNPRQIKRERRTAPSGRTYIGYRRIKIAGIELWREAPPPDSLCKSLIVKGLLDRATGEVWENFVRWERCDPPEPTDAAHEQLCRVEQEGAVSAPYIQRVGLARLASAGPPD
ncbi:MAG: replication endonuclease [Clostridia bacterium]|nr:replication endonuclease [Clostridia bacterium]